MTSPNAPVPPTLRRLKREESKLLTQAWKIQRALNQNADAQARIKERLK